MRERLASVNKLVPDVSVTLETNPGGRHRLSRPYVSVCERREERVRNESVARSRAVCMQHLSRPAANDNFNKMADDFRVFF